MNQRWLGTMPVISFVSFPFATEIALTCCGPPRCLCSGENFWLIFLLFSFTKSCWIHFWMRRKWRIREPRLNFSHTFFFPSLRWIKENQTYLWEKLTNHPFRKSMLWLFAGFTFALWKVFVWDFYFIRLSDDFLPHPFFFFNKKAFTWLLHYTNHHEEFA